MDAGCLTSYGPNLPDLYRRAAEFAQLWAIGAALFDHLVGAGEQRFGDVKADRFGCGQVENKIEPRRLLDRNVSRLRAVQNLVRELSGATVQVGQVWSIGHQASRIHEFSKPAHHRQSSAERRRADKSGAPEGAESDFADPFDGAAKVG